MDKLPLEGIRIVDCTQAWAGPHCTELLADLGAEVIKVESPYGDVARGSKKPIRGVYPNGIPGERPWNRAANFNPRNRNKFGCSLNLNREEGRQLFKELVKISDIVIDNFVSGTMDSLGVGYDELRKVKPDIIVASINGYGPSGPWSHYRSYGVVQEPMTGWMALTGYLNDETPLRSGVDHIDPQTGSHMAGAILAALLYRQKTGKGQKLNASMLESGISFIGPAILDYGVNGRILEHKGNRHNQDAMAPHGCYRCKGEDEWVTIAVGSDEEWESFCRVIGNPPWTKEGQFSDLYGRLKNQDDMDKRVESWTIEKDKYEAMHTLQRAGIAAGAVLSIAEMFSEPNLIARDYWKTVEHADAGTINQPGPRFKILGIPDKTPKPAPLYGEHNVYVFKELLGMSEAAFAQAIENNLIFNEPIESGEAGD
ncbi:CaiB/BaiF CoA transferase family protein [Chloroflexota bacterium]